MKDYSIRSYRLLPVIMMMMVSYGGFSQFVKPTPKAGDKPLQYKEAVAAYDQWIMDPANADAKGWKAYGRFIEQNRSRLNPDGNPADPGIFIKEAIRVAADKEAMESLKSGAGWSPVGPSVKPPSASSSFSHGMGRINCIAFHPTDPNTYFIGVAQGGVWKTVNGGESYTPLTDNLPILRVSDIAVNPKNPDNIFIAVCDYAYIGVALDTDYRKRHTHYGIGVYKTMDGGLTWTPTGLQYDQSDLDKTLIRRVFFHPTESGVLLAGGVSGIYRSADDGATWDLIKSEVIWDIEQDFNNGNVIYATTGTVRNTGGSAAKLLKSTNFGLSWNEMNTGWNGDTNIGRTEIGLTPASSEIVYLIAANTGGSFYGFYRSTNAGTTWEARNTMASNGVNILGAAQGWYDLALLVDPKNPQVIYTGGLDMYVSTNAGTTWTQSSFWVMSEDDFTLHADQHQYKYNPVDKKYYACHDGGVARTDTIIPGRGADNKWATRWQERSNGMIITSFYRIGLCEMFPGYVVGGAQDNSSFYNKNGNWINFIGGDGMDCMINPDDPNIVYGSSQYGSLVRSDNGGQNTRYISPSGFGQNTCEWTTPIVQDMNNPNFIYTANNQVWKSSTKGNTWNHISNFPQPAGNKPLKINALALYPKNSSVIFAAQRIHYEHNQPSKMWRTLDAGAHWVNVTAGLPDSLYFTSVCVDASDSLSAWVTCGGFLPGQKVYMTNDAGATWQNLSLNLPNIPVNTVVFQEDPKEDIIYIGTDAGVYYYKASNGNWQLYSNLLPNVIISELEIHEPTKKLYAGTFGRGIWMTDLIQSGGAGTGDQPFDQSRLNVFPNPTRGMVTIEANGILTNEVRLEIVSISGQQMMDLTVPVQGGNLKKTLTPDLQPGLYFLRVWAGDKHLTSKFLVQN